MAILTPTDCRREKFLKLCAFIATAISAILGLAACGGSESPDQPKQVCSVTFEGGPMSGQTRDCAVAVQAGKTRLAVRAGNNASEDKWLFRLDFFIVDEFNFGSGTWTSGWRTRTWTTGEPGMDRLSRGALNYGDPLPSDWTYADADPGPVAAGPAYLGWYWGNAIYDYGLWSNPSRATLTIDDVGSAVYSSTGEVKGWVGFAGRATVSLCSVTYDLRGTAYCTSPEIRATVAFAYR